MLLLACCLSVVKLTNKLIKINSLTGRAIYMVSLPFVNSELAPDISLWI